MARKSNTQITDKINPSAYPWGRLLEAVNEAWIRLPELGSLLPIFAAVWFTVAVLEVTLQAFIPASAMRNEDLPIGARFLLICYSISSSTIFLIAICGFLGLLRWVEKQFFTTWTVFRWLMGAFAALLTWFILLAYGASWGLFWQTRTFIDSQTIVFLAPHPLQVLHWVDVDMALTLVVLAAIGSWVIMSWIPRWIRRWPVILQRRLVLVWGWLIGVCLLGSFFGELYSGTDERQSTRTAILYTRSRDNASGPFPHVLGDIQKHLRYRPEERFRADDIRIIQRPIIAMERYVATAARPPTNRWNVIILVVESLRADQLRAYGATREVMPAVDDLTRESRVFLNAYCQSSHSDYATVTPLSSHYPLRSSTAYTYPENPSYPRVLIYDVLKALGYHTAIFSSSNEWWGGMINFLQTGNVDHFFHAANFKGPTYVMRGETALLLQPGDYASFADWTRKTRHAGSVDDRYTVGEAIQWIEGLKGEPFFIAMNLQSSHLPYVVPRDFPRRFGPEKLGFSIRFGKFPRDKTQVVKDVYADSLAYVDSQIARLLQYLKTNGMWDNTVVVLTGDHGQAFYEHNFASHASAIFNEVMRVPLVIRAPGLKPGLETRLAQHVDIAPSILELLGLAVHPSFQGIDLLNSTPDPKRSVYMVAQTSLAYQYGIVRSNFKLIYDEFERQYSLYDLTADPDEKADIASSQPTIVNELARRLQTWRTLQINYYADKRLHTREYPPILAD